MATLVLRRIYTTWSWVILAAVVVQFFLAGLGVFVSGASFGIHALFGAIIMLATLLGAIFALVARVPWRTTGLNTLLFVLILLQAVLIEVGRGTGIHTIAAFHVVNALAIFALAGTLALRSNAYLAKTTPEQTAPTVGASATPHPAMR